MRRIANSWKSSTGLRRGLAAALVLALALGFRAGASQETAPAIDIIDGDTLLIDGRHVQLAGIDAPELGQLCLHEGKAWPCGLEAARALTKLVALGRVRCEAEAAGEPLPTAVCRSGNEDIADSLLRQGYAVALPDGFPNYREAQAEAQKVPLGIWRGAFVAPPAWRDGQRLPQEAQAEARGCPVKGVVAPDGRRIYLVPIDPVYASIEIDPQRGDRLFCSDEEARLAGWSGRPEKPR